jgi:thiamine kinase-like enzyme
MQQDELQHLAAQHVPGKGKIDIHPMGDGLVNETYRVQRGGAAYSLRVAGANPYHLGVDRAWEARVLERAAAANLAPAVEYCDPQRGILLARWTVGQSWSPADVRRQANISRLAELLRRIHALQIPSPARVMSPATWIDYYSSAASATPDIAAALRALATQRLADLAGLPGVDPVLCHSDLHVLNLIDRNPSLVLLDWEYAHVSDPLWDLAGWSANNDVPAAFGRELLTRYLERTPTHNEYLRLQLCGWLYDYVCLLWSELYLYLRHNLKQGGAKIATVSARAQLLAARLGCPAPLSNPM